MNATEGPGRPEQRHESVPKPRPVRRSLDEGGTPNPEPRPCRWFDTVTLVVFITFVAGLLLLTLDHFLGFGIVRPKLDRQLLREINQLADPKLPAEQRNALEQDIISYHEFSVPLLIESIEKNKPGVREPATKCLQEIARTYFGSDITSLGSDPAKLKEWWRTIQGRMKASKAG